MVPQHPKLAWKELPHRSWSWVLLEKPPIVQPLKNFPAFYGIRRFITVFTRSLHWSLSWASSIQSIPSYPISLRSILILSTQTRLGLPINSLMRQIISITHELKEITGYTFERHGFNNSTVSKRDFCFVLGQCCGDNCEVGNSDH
jgi:hypothetical protein